MLVARPAFAPLLLLLLAAPLAAAAPARTPGDDPATPRGVFVPGLFAQSLAATNSSAPLPNFGLLLPSWRELDGRIDELEAADPAARFKLLLIVRHGEGIHNVAERTYGTPAWEEYYSRLPDYFDAVLTPVGVEQSIALRAKLDDQERRLGFPTNIPVLTSPLSRCINTTANVFPELFAAQPPRGAHRPIALEELRESVSFHTCDHRHSVSAQRAAYPAVRFGFMRNDEDVLWSPTESEDPDNMVRRIDAFFHWVFDDVQSQASAALRLNRDAGVHAPHRVRAPRSIRDSRYLIIATHGGTTYAIQKYLGHQRYPIGNADVFPILARWSLSADL